MFQRYGGRTSFSGQIVTLKMFEDNSLVREAFGEDGKGKVLVIDGGGSLRCALVGDQLAILAQEWLGRRRRLRLHPRLGRHQRHRHRRARPQHASAKDASRRVSATRMCRHLSVA
jgi:transposase-like protein